MTELREYIEAVVPEFLDAEIREYSEKNDDGSMTTIIQVRAEDGDNKYGAEFTNEHIEGLDKTIVRSFLLNGIASMFEQASEDRFDRKL